MLKSIINPDIYHGGNKKRNFFEGWYFKIVQPKLGKSYAFIPGIFYSKDSSYSHSFIQILDGKNSKFEYIKFGCKDFSASNSCFSIRINENIFSSEQIVLNIENSNYNIKGRLKLKNTLKWPDSLVNPGSMGFYNYLPIMQCYSQVCSMNSNLEGYLIINNEIVDFTDGYAYIEKNWGRDFPYSYIWVQCNTFTKETASLSCSIAHIPFPLGSFTGFLIGFYFKDTFFEFSTINFSKLKIETGSRDVYIMVHNKKYTLSIKTETSEKEFMKLFAPRSDKMVPIAQETLSGLILLTMTDNRNGRVIFQDTGIYSGVEFSGKYHNLIV